MADPADLTSEAGYERTMTSPAHAATMRAMRAEGPSSEIARLGRKPMLHQTSDGACGTNPRTVDLDGNDYVTVRADAPRLAPTEACGWRGESAVPPYRETTCVLPVGHEGLHRRRVAAPTEPVVCPTCGGSACEYGCGVCEHAYRHDVKRDACCAPENPIHSSPCGAVAAPTEDAGRCECGHAAAQHNGLGYCRSRTTSDRSGDCACMHYTPAPAAVPTEDGCTPAADRTVPYIAPTEDATARHRQTDPG